MNRFVPAGLLLFAVLGAGCQEECDEVLSAETDIIRGETVYISRCSDCHGDEGQGVSGPALTERLPSLTSCDIVSVVRSGPESMPPYDEGTISTQDLANLIEFITLEFQ